jgi:hypothetical protein
VRGRRLICVATGALVCLGLSAAPVIAATRTFEFTIKGDQTVNYTLKDVGTDSSRPGCLISEHGSTTIEWRNSWKLDAVARNGNVVRIKNLRHVKGPILPNNVSYSNIKGKNTNMSSGSCGKGAGSYDCTAKPIKPLFYSPSAANGSLQSGGGGTMTLYSFDRLSATYSGQAPSGYPCSSLGSNFLPGGALAGEFQIPTDNLTFKDLYEDLSSFKHVGGTSHTTILAHSGSWGEDTYGTGEGCWTNSQRNPGDSCTTGDTGRSAHLTTVRVQ